MAKVSLHRKRKRVREEEEEESPAQDSWSSEVEVETSEDDIKPRGGLGGKRRSVGKAGKRNSMLRSASCHDESSDDLRLDGKRKSSADARKFSTSKLSSKAKGKRPERARSTSVRSVEPDYDLESESAENDQALSIDSASESDDGEDVVDYHPLYWIERDEAKLQREWSEFDQLMIENTYPQHRGLWHRAMRLYKMNPLKILGGRLTISIKKNKSQFTLSDGTKVTNQNWSGSVCDSFSRLLSCPIMAAKATNVRYLLELALYWRLGRKVGQKPTEFRETGLYAEIVDDIKKRCEIDISRKDKSTIMTILEERLGKEKFLDQRFLTDLKKIVTDNGTDDSDLELIKRDFDSICDAWDVYIKRDELKAKKLKTSKEAFQAYVHVRGRRKKGKPTKEVLAMALMKRDVMAVRRSEARRENMKRRQGELAHTMSSSLSDGEDSDHVQGQDEEFLPRHVGENSDIQMSPSIKEESVDGDMNDFDNEGIRNDDYHEESFAVNRFSESSSSILRPSREISRKDSSSEASLHRSQEHVDEERPAPATGLSMERKTVAVKTFEHKPECCVQ